MFAGVSVVAMAELEEENVRLTEAVKKLVEVLEPFANDHVVFSRAPSNDNIRYHLNSTDMTVGDLRRARTAYYDPTVREVLEEVRDEA